jgi:hypothetical protein
VSSVYLDLSKACFLKSLLCCMYRVKGGWRGIKEMKKIFRPHDRWITTHDRVCLLVLEVSDRQRNCVRNHLTEVAMLNICKEELSISVYRLCSQVAPGTIASDHVLFVLRRYCWSKSIGIGRLQGSSYGLSNYKPYSNDALGIHYVSRRDRCVVVLAVPEAPVARLGLWEAGACGRLW